MASFYFEELSTPALFFGPSGVLSLYASGLTTGTVLSVGHHATTVTPVYEGLCLSHSVTGTSVAGARVDDMFVKSLREECGLHLTSSSDIVTARTLKQKCGIVSPPGADAPAPADFLLPDGTPVSLPGAVRTQPYEVLFNPSLAGLEEPPVPLQLHQGITSADRELRARLYESVVLAGGTTMASGFGQRLLTELRARAPQHTKVKITAPLERESSAWVGGSILASLSTFKNLWISREQWLEEGEAALRVKML